MSEKLFSFKIRHDIIKGNVYLSFDAACSFLFKHFLHCVFMSMTLVINQTYFPTLAMLQQF